METFQLFALFIKGISFIFPIAGLIIILLVIREIVMWYWKINEILKVLKQIEINTRKSLVESNPKAEPSLLTVEVGKQESEVTKEAFYNPVLFTLSKEKKLVLALGIIAVVGVIFYFIYGSQLWGSITGIWGS
ncbi:MAG: hypothetical protein Q7R93_00995 [bacterium]|nr:hypothetical protein [bacterium]